MTLEHNDALHALFGNADTHDVPESLENYRPTPQLMAMLGGTTFERFVRETATRLAREATFFEEVVADSLHHRGVRNRVLGRNRAA